MKNLKLFIISTLIIFSCSTPKEEVQLIASPTGQESAMPRLFTNHQGQTYMSWVETPEEGKALLYYSKLTDDSWSTPQLISEGENWFVNWADFPSMIENNGHMAAHWLQKSDQGTFDYDVRVSMSTDEGNSWGDSFIPHKDGVAAEHGFVSMLPLENRQTFVTWLDGRNTKTGEMTDHSDGHGSGPMSLRAAIFDKNGRTVSEWELDDRVCDCCQTTAVQTDSGITVIYRDRSENEIRDMSVVRLVNNQWTEPKPLKVELWEMPACPVNGPSASANGDHMAVAWFMAKGGTPEVKLAFSENGGADFKEAIVISEGNTSGRVSTTMLNDGTVLVSWLESQGDTAQIMLAQYDKSRGLLKKLMIAQSTASRASGFPVLSSNGQEVYIAWTEADVQKEIKTAKINL